jgi:glycerate kinase
MTSAGPRVLIASDKFKGSLTAIEVAAAVAEGVRRARPDATVTSVPVADGGDGTLAAAAAAGFEMVDVPATGPIGQPVTARYARRDRVAVVELADVSGLVRLPGGQPAPGTPRRSRPVWAATTSAQWASAASSSATCAGPAPFWGP